MLSLSLKRVIDCAYAISALRCHTHGTIRPAVLCRDNEAALRRAALVAVSGCLLRVVHVLKRTNIAGFDTDADDVVEIVFRDGVAEPPELRPALESAAAAGILSIAYGEADGDAASHYQRAFDEAVDAIAHLDLPPASFRPCYLTGA